MVTPIRSWSRMPRSAVNDAVQAVELAAHGQRASERTVDVILVRRRHPEDGHHGVPDELLDTTAAPLHLGAHRVEVAAHDRPQGLRIQRLAEAGEARDIREDHGHDLALLVRGGGRQHASAAGAEAASGIDRPATRGAGTFHGDHRSPGEPRSGDAVSGAVARYGAVRLVGGRSAVAAPCGGGQLPSSWTAFWSWVSVDAANWSAVMLLS